MMDTERLKRLAALGREAQTRNQALARVANAPRVRELHEHGFCVNTIRRKTGHSEKYIRAILAEMGLTPNVWRYRRAAEASAPPPVEAPAVPAAPVAPHLEQAGCADEQGRFFTVGASACDDHFRDLVAAYPGRKLKSLNIPDAFAPTRYYAPVEPAFSSQSALCLEGPSAVFR